MPPERAMEFSTVGVDDSLDEARARLSGVDALIVWGGERIIGVITEECMSKSGDCGAVCDLDVLVDPNPEMVELWKPKFVIITDNGEPVLLNRGP